MLRHGLQASVIVAVLPMRMVQVPLYEIVGVVPVQHRLVPAVRSMNVIGLMRPTLVVRRAAISVGWSDSQLVFVDVISVNVMQMAVVEIIGVAVVYHCHVTAIRTVDVRMCFLFHAGLRHFFPLFAVGSFPEGQPECEIKSART